MVDEALAPAAAPEDAALLRGARLKFASGNDVPVERAWITRKEWDAVERALQCSATQGDK